MDDSLTHTKPATNALLSNVQLQSKPLNRSWFEEVEDFESEMMQRRLKLEESSAATSSDPKTGNEKEYVLMTATESESSKMEEPETPTEREIVVQFLDSSNEEKYERLIKEEKIKTPLKRRLSSNSNSRSNSPYFDEATSCGTSVNSDESGQRFFSKKSKVDIDGKSKNREFEKSEEILARRQKQIDYGKNTIGYDLYSKQVARSERTADHPWTPPKNYKYSRRAFDGMIKVWRKKLHCYDPASHNSGVGGADVDSSD